MADANPLGARLFGREQLVFWCIVGGAITILGVAISVPFMADILRFALPTPSLSLVSVVIGLLAGSWYGVAKRMPARLLAQA